MKILKEDYTYSKEQIYSYIDELEEAYHTLRDCLYVLSTSLEGNYSTEAKFFDSLTTDFEEYGSKLFQEISDLKDELDPSEEDDVEESLEESILVEKKWKYQLSKEIASALRDAIDEEDYLGVCAMLQSAWQEINKMMPDSFDDSELEDKIDEIDIIDETDEDEVNYQLDDFYDFCDAMNIWIPLD